MKLKIFSTAGWEFKGFAHLQYFITGFDNTQELIFVPFLFGYSSSVSGHNPTALIWQKICLGRKNTFPQHVLGCQPLQVVHKYSFEAVNCWLGLHIQHPTFVRNPPQPPLEKALQWPFWVRCVLGYWCSPFSLRSSLQKNPGQLFACWVSVQMLWNLIFRFI